MQSTPENVNNFLNKLSSSDSGGMGFVVPSQCHDIILSPTFYSFNVIEPEMTAKHVKMAQSLKIPLHGDKPTQFGKFYLEFPYYGKFSLMPPTLTENDTGFFDYEQLQRFMFKLHELQEIKRHYDVQYQYIKTFKDNAVKSIMEANKCLQSWNLEQSRKKTDPNQKYEDCIMNVIKSLKELKKVDTTSFNEITADRKYIFIEAFYSMKNKQFKTFYTELI